MAEEDIQFLQTHHLPDVINTLMEDILLDRPNDVYKWIQDWAAAKACAMAGTPDSFKGLLTPCVWTMEEHATDILEVDMQHAKLFKLINQLIVIVTSLKSDPGSNLNAIELPYSALLPIAQELMAYTKYHFDEEEAHFSPTAYPGKAAHIAKHKSFVARFARFLVSVEQQTCTAEQLARVLKFLKDWVVNHVQTMDREYLPYLPPKMHVYDMQQETPLSPAPRRKVHSNQRL